MPVVGLLVVAVVELVEAAEIEPEPAHLVELVVVASELVPELDSAVRLALLPGLAVAGGPAASWQSALAAAYFAFAADSMDSVVHGLVPFEPEYSPDGALLLVEPSTSVDAVAEPAAAAASYAQLVVAVAEDVVGG